MSKHSPDFIDIDWNNRTVSIEYQWLGINRQHAPLIIFLHEGLGSLSMWKNFPEQLCDELGFRGLVYSRPGYGQSSPRPADEKWEPDYMHQQACQVLPGLMDALGIETQSHPPWLFGHSDGASIALLYASRFPDQLAGAIVLAPHIFIEELALNSIAQARKAYLNTDLKEKLGRYHRDPDSAFWGWNDSWLNPDFHNWSIESDITAIRCPLLAVQGLEDEYGTLAQIHGIARHVPYAQLLELAHCRHSPHRDRTDTLITATKQFINSTDSCRNSRLSIEIA